MPDRDILLGKTDSIRRALARIRDVTRMNPASLDDINIQDIFVLNLQRAIQSAIDLAAHVVASEALGLPDSIKANFQLLENGKIIGKDLSAKLQAMAGFRNIAIHEYQTIDVDVLKSILTRNLQDLESFYATVLHRYQDV